MALWTAWQDLLALPPAPVQVVVGVLAILRRQAMVPLVAFRVAAGVEVVRPHLLRAMPLALAATALVAKSG